MKKKSKSISSCKFFLSKNNIATTKPKFTKHEDALLVQKANQWNKEFEEVIKNDFEDKTKIELKQRFKELEGKILFYLKFPFQFFLNFLIGPELVMEDNEILDRILGNFKLLTF